MWETTVMYKQVSGWTVNFGPNLPLSGIEDQNTPPPPHFGMWDDQSLLRNTPPPHFTSDLGWPKFTPKVSHFGKLQIWDDQSLLRNTPPPFWKTSDLGWPKFCWKTSWPKEIPPPPPLQRTKVYSEIPPPPHFGKLGDSLLRILENFRFGMTKVFTPPPNRKLSKSSIFSEYRELLWRLYPTGITTIIIHSTLYYTGRYENISTCIRTLSFDRKQIATDPLFTSNLFGTFPQLCFHILGMYKHYC